MQYPGTGPYTMDDLLEIVRILRAPGGCPWDAEQTHASIRQNLLEEAYEVADAIDRQSTEDLCEELGDLLLQVALHVQMEQEAGGFSFNDVCDAICRKLIYRHPHVFGQVQQLATGQVLDNWEKLKNAEKGRDTAASRLDSVPQSLPAAMYAEKVQKRAAAYGFCYADTAAALADLASEVE
ncbi:MazG family protein, partial [Ruminococcaceae bacterium OttesenSCG-928-O06]|nr:MazG family protein [Ruminococcaceae bacterium OttesenSCG-928-O06]